MKKPHKILGVIGDPISHSLSPIMHNAGLAFLKLPYLYEAYQIHSQELGDFLKRLKKKNIVGLNVTIPHKKAVIPFMASLSREARLIGAVNTILVKKSGLYGHNTDGQGYIASLEKEASFDPEGKQIILLGAGGAARALCVALGMAKAREVVIINRTAKKAHDLALEMNKKLPQTIYSAASFETMEKNHWSFADLVVNTTSMGMKGTRWVKLPLSKLPRRAVVSDIVYNPLETPLLKKAKRLKLQTHPGWGMLLYQGVLSFELWTKKKAPLDVMKKALLEGLNR